MEIKNVLVVDDDEAIIDLFNLVGKKIGLNIISAENGEEAFQTFGYMDFFMAVTDLNMPKMNGVELIKKVRNIPKYRNFPFLIISANLNDFDSEIAFIENIDVKEKPLTKDQIEEIFKHKLQIHDENAKLINESELLDQISIKIIEPCSLLMQVLTKSEPQHEYVQMKKGSHFFTSDYFVAQPCFIAGNRITFIFSFEKELAYKIKMAVKPDSSKEEDIHQCLLKAINPMMIKLFEVIGRSLDYSNNHLPAVFGTGSDRSIYTYDYGEIHNSIKLTNDFGAMHIYLIYEA